MMTNGPWAYRTGVNVPGSDRGGYVPRNAAVRIVPGSRRSDLDESHYYELVDAPQYWRTRGGGRYHIPGCPNAGQNYVVVTREEGIRSWSNPMFTGLGTRWEHKCVWRPAEPPPEYVRSHVFVSRLMDYLYNADGPLLLSEAIRELGAEFRLSRAEMRSVNGTTGYEATTRSYMHKALDLGWLESQKDGWVLTKSGFAALDQDWELEVDESHFIELEPRGRDLIRLIDVLHDEWSRSGVSAKQT